MKEIVDYLLMTGDTQLDAQMKPFIEKWNNPPTAIQILEVLDYCIHGALASSFVVTLLQTMYDMACEDDKTTHEAVVRQATWRHRL